jgi:TonB family protein
LVLDLHDIKLVQQTGVYMTTFLSNLYLKHISIALAISVSFHLTIIFGYYLMDNLSFEEVTYGGSIYIDYINLPQPTILEEPLIAQPKIITESIPATEGIPVPVPETDVSPERTIPTQKEMGNELDMNKEIFGHHGTVVVEKAEINIADPDPDIFIPVERLPVPIKQVQPEYPQLALRTGIEGTVWVKILVDKDGKAKKVIVSKSDSEILNDTAINAAFEWLFIPAMMSNGAVAVWVTVPFRFKLKKN